MCIVACECDLYWDSCVLTAHLGKTLVTAGLLTKRYFFPPNSPTAVGSAALQNMRRKLLLIHFSTFCCVLFFSRVSQKFSSAKKGKKYFFDKNADWTSKFPTSSRRETTLVDTMSYYERQFVWERERWECPPPKESIVILANINGLGSVYTWTIDQICPKGKNRG